MTTKDKLTATLFDMSMIALALLVGWYTWRMGTEVFDRSRVYTGLLALAWVVVPTLFIVRARFVRAKN